MRLRFRARAALPALALALALHPPGAHAQRHRRTHPHTDTPPQLPAALDTFVNDYAGLLTPEDRDGIRATLSRVRRETGVQATVLTIGSPRDYPAGDMALEPFATRVFNAWGVGDSLRSNGILVLVALHERAVRVELGSSYPPGMEGRMREVVDGTILPRFREGDYSAGIREGVDSVLAATAVTEPVRTAAGVVHDPPEGVASPAVVGILAAVLIAAAGIAFTMWSAERPDCRYCTGCGGKMRPLPEPARTEALSAGQKKEEEIGSVAHTVWGCACGRHETTSAVRDDRWTACPECAARTLAISRRVLVQPAGGVSGVSEVTQVCRSCGLHTRDVVPVMYTSSYGYGSHHHHGSSGGSSSSSGGGGGGGGGGSSFGGGSSSGGGASGSW
ncbi:MAG TPA: TPM domain-containing protein [Longimicrobiaceae bacterium]|jgi:uncharacterized protein|nr:TPM domain-containing protein [Longimicrobiaceae bacterium]